MTHFASEGFGFPGGVGPEEFAHLDGSSVPFEGAIFRVISMPATALDAAETVAFTQYSTCFAHNLARYVAEGWRDEGFEATAEKPCVDWIERCKADRSRDAVLAASPELRARELRAIRDAHTVGDAKAAYDKAADMRRGKYC